MKFYGISICLITALSTFIFTMKILEPYQLEREKSIIKIQSLQSCYFSLTKKGNGNIVENSNFCLEHSKKTTKNYIDIGYQMNKIVDKQYSPATYWSSIIKREFRKIKGKRLKGGIVSK